MAEETDFWNDSIQNPAQLLASETGENYKKDNYLKPLEMVPKSNSK